MLKSMHNPTSIHSSEEIMIKLRDYQAEAIASIQNEWQCVDSTLLVAATGAGKTIMMLALIAELLTQNPLARVLLIAHRRELIFQPVERMRDLFPALYKRCGIVMGARDDAGAQIVVATVQTLASEKRLQRVLAHGAIDYIFTDEAHHAAADNYKSIYERVGARKHLGVTATPKRSDNKGLVEVYESVAGTYDMGYLISHGHLCMPRWLAIKTGISLAGVSVHGRGDKRDYSASSLKQVFELKNVFDMVAAAHKKFAQGRRGIAFTASVEGAHALCDSFNNAGVFAVAADASTDRTERKRHLAAFADGQIDMLVNCQLYTEGLDLPAVDVVHMARPTKSDSLYLQMIGRGLRVFPGKTDCLVMEYAPEEVRGVVSLGDVLGQMPGDKRGYFRQGVANGEVEAGFTFDGEQATWLEGDPMQLIAQRLDYLESSRLRWNQPNRRGGMAIGLGKDEQGVERLLYISETTREGAELWGVWKHEGERWHSARVLKTGCIDALSEEAEAIAQRRGNGVLMNKNKRWIKRPPSEGQLRFAKNLGIHSAPAMTRGEIADAINFKLAENAVKRARRRAIENRELQHAN